MPVVRCIEALNPDDAYQGMLQQRGYEIGQSVGLLKTREQVLLFLLLMAILYKAADDTGRVLSSTPRMPPVKLIKMNSIMNGIHARDWNSSYCECEEL